MACASCQKSAAARAGSSAVNAIVYGDPEQPTYRVKVKKPGHGLVVGAVKYVRGSEVQALIDSEDFQVLLTIENVEQKRGKTTKLWYVGTVGYTTLQQAQVASVKNGGADIVEREIE